MRFFGGTKLYPRKEGDLASKSHHWSGEGAIEAPWSRRTHLGIGDSYAGCIYNSILGEL